MLPEIVGFLPPAEAELLRSEIDKQARNRPQGLPQGAIHADLFRDNVLFETFRIAGVIDFYFACTDALLYDVAICANDWCISEDGRLDEARTRALLEAYQATRPLTSAAPPTTGRGARTSTSPTAGPAPRGSRSTAGSTHPATARISSGPSGGRRGSRS